MNKYVIIPTMKTEAECLSQETTVGKLNSYLQDAGWKVHFSRNAKSIFDAHSEGLKHFGVGPDDYVILCHDDIEILVNPTNFNSIISNALSKQNIGFIGVAGTSYLDDTLSWFHCAMRNKTGCGYINHGTSITSMRLDYFGNQGKSVVIDGVFLAATGKVLNSIRVAKPSVLQYNWAWYDTYYTLQTHKKGLTNLVVNLPIRHDSTGRYNPEYWDDLPRFKELVKEILPAVVR